MTGGGSPTARPAARGPAPGPAPLPATLPPLAGAPLLGVLAVLAAVLAVTAGRYGWHRDELYFRVAAEHLAWGYVDQPPLTPALARLAGAVLGDTLYAGRVVALLLALGSVTLVALLTRELGGGRAAQVLAAAATAASTFVLAVGHLLATASADVLLWLAVILVAVRLLRTADPRWYAPLGAVLGLGLLNKFLIGALALGLLAGVAVAGPRRLLATPWLAVGVGLATLVAAPTLIWQATHGWPQLEVAAGLADEGGTENRALLVPLQLVFLSPLFVPLCLAGAVRLWRDPAVRFARALVPAYLLVAAATLALAGKAYYLVPLLLALLAAGAPLAVRRLPGRILTAVVLVAAAVNVVGALPVLPPAALGPIVALNAEQGEQVGWETFTATVASAWDRIPVDQRSGAVVYTTNYGQAGALDRFGPAYGLPAPYSAHMSYADWGTPPDTATGPVVVVAHERNRAATTYFTGCRHVATVDHGYAWDNGEQGIWVRLCTGTTRPWSQLWPLLRHTS